MLTVFISCAFETLIKPAGPPAKEAKPSLSTDGIYIYNIYTLQTLVDTKSLTS